MNTVKPVKTLLNVTNVYHQGQTHLYVNKLHLDILMII